MGRNQEFTELYNIYAPKVFKLCLGYAAGDHDLAKDWQQETFIKVWTHLKNFKGNSAIGTWIFRIAVNVCLNGLRKKKKFAKIDIIPNFSEVDDLDETEITEKNLKKMFQCIDMLNNNNKTMILLNLEGVPQKEIAEVVGITYGGLRTRLGRIKQTLLKCISNDK